MNSKLTSERLAKILSETQATIMEHNSRCVRGPVDVDARLFESMLIELQERRKAAMGSEFIPKNLDRALGVLGMALPESKEEFNLQTNRWIQRLIDRVIRYSDEFKAQPAPVVLDERAAFNAWNNDENLPIAGAGAKNAAWLAWQARAAMVNSPVIPDGWVICSERMPESNEYVLVCNGVWVGMGMYNNAEHFEDCERWQDEHGEFIDLLHHPVTHWMPLPAAPQEVS